MWNNDKLLHGAYAMSSLHMKKIYSTWGIYNICCFIVIYVVWAQNPLCCDLRTFVWSKNILSVEQKWKISCMVMTNPTQDALCWCRFTYYLGLTNLELLFLALKSKNQHVCSSTKVDISIWEKMIGDGRSSWLWIKNAWDDVPIEISDKTHILLPYMHQLLSARNALFFRNCKVFGNS